MNKNNSNVLERLAAIDALNNNYENSNYLQNTLNDDSKNRILAQEKNNSIDYQLADFCISSKILLQILIILINEIILKQEISLDYE